MDINFNPDTQYLVFKPQFTETFYVYKGQSYPAYTIDPITCTQEEMQQYWNAGLYDLFDIINKPV